MWHLSGNEKTQQQLDAYRTPLKFKKSNDEALNKKTITLASVIWRMVFKQEQTCYEGTNHQCDGHRSRSVEDMYSVAKNYVKKGLTREDVEKAIDKLKAKGLISQSFCDDIKRRVHVANSLTTTLKQIKDALK